MTRPESLAINDELCAPAEIINAISILNVHARAHGFGRKAIYAYKTFVAAEFAIEARPVMVMVRCHHCSGTGIYRDWDGYARGTCYRCTKGIATLRFIESTIGDCRWHHPINSGGRYVLDAVWDIASVKYPQHGDEIAVLADGTEHPIVFRQAEGWAPNEPGARQLPTDEACRLLNLVEGWLRGVPQMRRSNRWTIGKAREEMWRYRVRLERDDDTACCMCGRNEGGPMVRCCGLCSKSHFGWTDFSRSMCAACHGPSNSPRWPTEPHPASLTPNVVEWLSQPERQVPFRAEPEW